MACLLLYVIVFGTVDILQVGVHSRCDMMCILVSTIRCLAGRVEFLKRETHSPVSVYGVNTSVSMVRNIMTSWLRQFPVTWRLRANSFFEKQSWITVPLDLG